MSKNLLKAIIFDLDGTISDTNLDSARIESRLLKKHGVEIAPKELLKKFVGMKTIDIFSKLLEGKNADIEKIVDEKWRLETEWARKEAEAIPGAIDLVNKTAAMGYKLAVASSSRREYVLAVLKKLGIRDRFISVTTGDEVKNGKPDPEIFLLAVKRLEAVPGECLVFEDSIYGMEAAKRAGMQCVGIVDKDDKKDFPADYLVNKWEELDVDEVLK